MFTEANKNQSQAALCWQVIAHTPGLPAHSLAWFWPCPSSTTPCCRPGVTVPALLQHVSSALKGLNIRVNSQTTKLTWSDETDRGGKTPSTLPLLIRGCCRPAQPWREGGELRGARRAALPPRAARTERTAVPRPRLWWLLTGAAFRYQRPRTPPVRGAAGAAHGEGLA